MVRCWATKVICHFTPYRGEVCNGKGGHAMVRGRGKCEWPIGGHVWLGGVCMAGGHALAGGISVVGGMCGEGNAWGVYVDLGDVCMAGRACVAAGVCTVAGVYAWWGMCGGRDSHCNCRVPGDTSYWNAILVHLDQKLVPTYGEMSHQSDLCHSFYLPVSDQVLNQFCHYKSAEYPISYLLSLLTKVE